MSIQCVYLQCPNPVEFVCQCRGQNSHLCRRHLELHKQQPGAHQEIPYSPPLSESEVLALHRKFTDYEKSLKFLDRKIIASTNIIIADILKKSKNSLAKVQKDLKRITMAHENLLCSKQILPRDHELINLAVIDHNLHFQSVNSVTGPIASFYNIQAFEIDLEDVSIIDRRHIDHNIDPRSLPSVLRNDESDVGFFVKNSSTQGMVFFDLATNAKSNHMLSPPTRLPYGGIIQKVKNNQYLYCGGIVENKMMSGATYMLELSQNGNSTLFTLPNGKPRWGSGCAIKGRVIYVFGGCN